MTPEGRVKAKVKRWLDARAIWYFCPVSNGMGRHGIPDFVGCRKRLVTPDMVGQFIGEFFSVETKAEGKANAATPLQLECHDEIRQAGGVAVVVDRAEMLDAYDT
jgi:hypothetical protein